EDKEIQAYIKYLENKFPDETLKSLSIIIDGKDVNLDYIFQTQNFEKIRKITDYLVGTLNHFNNAKAAEESDRVKYV
ncbi:hypothetical protein, partial [Thomasclavelia cocleata]